MDGMQAGIGHNSERAGIPPALDAEILRDQIPLDHAALMTRRDELLAEAVRYSAAHPKGPANDEEAGALGDLIKDIKTAAKQATDAHAAAKKPYLDCGRVVDHVLKQDSADRLATTSTTLETVLGRYAAEKARIERERLIAEQRRAEQEAQRIADLAAQERNAVLADRMMEQAVEAADKADDAGRAAAAPKADLSRVRGNYGSNTSLRDKWTYRVDDLMTLVKAVAEGREPLHYLALNESVVGAAVRAKGGVRAIAGLTIENQPKAVVL